MRFFHMNAFSIESSFINMRKNCATFYLSATITLNLALMLIHQLPFTNGNDWSANCASNCTCKWTNGKKSAICSSLELTTIPTTLSTELQVLVLNDNHIPYLNREEFTNLGLLNLQRIYLKKSEIQYVHKETFKNLKILVEIDLSDNKIEMLDKDTFMGNDRLRILYLSGNPLKRLLAYQFPILPHLRTLDLHNCLISFIDPLALANLNLLEFLNLKNNLLESLSEYVFQHMTNLKTLTLDENPWQCNCKLRKFRNWYVKSKLNSVSLLCKGPPSQKDKQWENVNEALFGCAPKVEIFNNEDVQNIDIGSNTTFSCLAYGDPLPEVSWELNGKILDNDNVIFDTENIASDKLWSNLTVFNMSSLDAGTYACTGTNVVGSMSQNISIYLTEIVQHVLIKTPETFWYFGLIMGTFGTVFLLILISFVVCLCKRTTRQRRHTNKSGVKPSVSFNDQEKKLLDLSITTTTNDRGDSCGIDNNTSISKTESVIGFEPIEIHAVENHRGGHAHHGVLVGGHHQLGSHQQQMQHAANNALLSNRQQLMAVADGSCSVVGIPTSLASAVAKHPNQIPEEFPLNVGVFPPPPEFCSNIVPNPAYGNIFISVSVTQDMLEGADINMYPDLLNIPKRLQDNSTITTTTAGMGTGAGAGAGAGLPGLTSCTANGVVTSAANNIAAGIAMNSTILPVTSTSTANANANISPFATLPRNTPRRGILKKDSSLQQHQQQLQQHHQQQHQQQQQQQQTSLYPHDDIVAYHNLDTTYSQAYQEHQQRLHANNMMGLPPPPPPPSVTIKCHHNQNAKPCAGCIGGLVQPGACSTPPLPEATPLHPLTAKRGNGCLKYDNMGRRITAKGHSTLSLPDEDDELQLETRFGEVESSIRQQGTANNTITNTNTITTSSSINKKQPQVDATQSQQHSSTGTATGPGVGTATGASMNNGGDAEFVTL